MREIKVIPCLDIKDGRVVKGIKFVDLRDARDPVEAARTYCREGADELVFLDIFATVENRKTRMEWVKREVCGYGCENGECKDGQERIQWINYMWILIIFMAAVAAIGLYLFEKSEGI